MVSETLAGQDFQTQGHYGKVKGQIKVIPCNCTLTSQTNVPTKYQLPTPYGVAPDNVSPTKCVGKQNMARGAATFCIPCHNLYPLCHILCPLVIY